MTKPLPRKNLFTNTSFSVAVGMGINLLDIPDVADYLNTWSTSGRTDEFQVVPDFFISGEYLISPTFAAKFEYDYMFAFFNVLSSNGPLDESLQIFMPTFFLEKLYPEKYTMVKLGGGIGYHYAAFQETALGSTITYRSSGVGLKGEIEANTALSESFFAYLGSDLRINIQTPFESDKKFHLLINDPKYTHGYRAASLNFFSLGFKLGLIFYV